MLPIAATAGPKGESLQWDYCALVPAATDISLDVPSPTVGQNSWYGEPFPYTVPVGKALGIVSAMVSSKLRALRAGYFNVDNVLSLPADIGLFTYPLPFVVPGGVTLHGHLINNNTEDAQWMCAWMQGVLIEAPKGVSYRRLFPSSWGR